MTSFIGILIALTLVRKVIHVPTTKKLEICYVHRQETKEFINNYFETHKIEIEDVNFNVVVAEDRQIYTNIYTINLPKGMSYADVIEELSIYKNITKLRLVSI